jgi:regulator of replication initiation timing
MSTSPSWFDQEKFSRLVKKVGPKPVPEAVQAQPAGELENRSGPGLASTARISLVSKPPSLLSEHRALPALPRRTSTMPSLKALFPESTPSQKSPPSSPPSSEAADTAPVEESEPKASTQTLPASKEIKEDKKEPISIPSADVTHEVDTAVPFSRDADGLTAAWQKMGMLNEELAYAIQERDHALKDGDLLREQLRQAHEALKARGTKAPGQTQELSLLTEERDQARREYAAIRQEFETLKQEQPPKEESGRARKELEQQLEGFRQKLEERNRETAALKTNSGGVGDGDEKLKAEVVSLREQLAHAKEEASIAQRGLALSQKALHETRDTLREATEGTSLSRHNFDNLKNECATLAQQNSVLQAQNDQLSRDLSATKSKLTTRL